MCARAPVRAARSMTAAIAAPSASRGRDARKSAYDALCGCGAASMSAASSACTISSESPASASTDIAASISSTLTARELVDARVHEEALEPEHAGRRRAARGRAALPGTTPPQNPTSTNTSPSAAARFTASASTVVVGGMLLSGMSTIVVTPPAAAARVADAKPSHSVRPGSLTCTCVSTSPGMSTSSSASTMVRAAPDCVTDAESASVT